MITNHSDEIPAMQMPGDNPKDIPIGIYHTLPDPSETLEYPKSMQHPRFHEIRILYYSDGSFIAEYTETAQWAHSEEIPSHWLPTQSQDLQRILSRNV